MHVVRTAREHVVRTAREHVVRTAREHVVRTACEHVVRTAREDVFRTAREHVVRTKLIVLVAFPFTYPVSMFLFCLSHSYIYLLYFCPNWDRS